MPKKESLEHEVQKRFFEIITDQKNNKSTNAYKVYQKLVFYRFEEIIRTNFPEFCKEVSEKEFIESIYLFLENPPSTPFVWQIANDYRKMVKKEKLFPKKKYLYELLYFDWIEVEIYMKEYKQFELSDFSWDKSYYLSTWSRIKKFNYDIINKDYKQKRENYLIIYYDYSSDDVLFREINQFLFILFKKINKKSNISEVLEKLCKENEIDFKEAKLVLEASLKELVLNKSISSY